MQNIVLMTGLEPPGPFAAPGPSNLCTITARSTRSVRACLRASSCWKLPVASFQCSAKKAHPAPSSHVAGPLAPPREHARARGAQRRRGAASSTTRRLTSTAWPRSSPAGLWRAPPTSRFTPGLPPTAPTTRGFSHAHAASRRPDTWLPPLSPFAAATSPSPLSSSATSPPPCAAVSNRRPPPPRAAGPELGGGGPGAANPAALPCRGLPVEFRLAQTALRGPGSVRGEMRNRGVLRCPRLVAA